MHTRRGKRSSKILNFSTIDWYRLYNHLTKRTLRNSGVFLSYIWGVRMAQSVRTLDWTWFESRTRHHIMGCLFLILYLMRPKTRTHGTTRKPCARSLVVDHKRRWWPMGCLIFFYSTPAWTGKQSEQGKDPSLSTKRWSSQVKGDSNFRRCLSASIWCCRLYAMWIRKWVCHKSRDCSQEE